jgi:hypothetical protein
MNGFDRAQAAYDSAEPFAYTAAQEDEIERRVNAILRELAAAARDIIHDYTAGPATVYSDEYGDDELSEAVMESAVERLKEIA